MTVADTIDKISDWIKNNVASQIKLKLPDDKKNTANYQYKLVHPAVFTMLVPSNNDRNAPMSQIAPSITVQLVDGSEQGEKGRINVKFHILTWSTGLHGSDVLNRVDDKSDQGHLSQLYEIWNDADSSEYYKRFYEGWRDVWNLTDILLRELRSNIFIDGIKLCTDAAIEYGQYSDRDLIIDFAPYWASYVTASFEYGLGKTISDIDDFLEGGLYIGE